MAKLAPLPLGNGAPQVSGAEVHHIHRLQPRYYAFLSYSHRDKETADWLYGELERFRVPHALQAASMWGGTSKGGYDQPSLSRAPLISPAPSGEPWVAAEPCLVGAP